MRASHDGHLVRVAADMQVKEWVGKDVKGKIFLFEHFRQYMIIFLVNSKIKKCDMIVNMNSTVNATRGEKKIQGEGNANL